MEKSIMNFRELTLEERIENIEKSMTNIKPDGEQIKRIESVREAYKKVIPVLLNKTKQSREQSIAITKLEESLMWATKSIALESKAE
jgi:hypothetical protein